MLSKGKLKRLLSNSDDSGSDDESNDELSIIEEESDSEPELECDNWDDDCKIVHVNYLEKLIGYHLMPTCSRNSEEMNAKKHKPSMEIRYDLLKDDFISSFKANWSDTKQLCKDDVELIVNPFKVCVINNFLEQDGVLMKLRQEFDNIEWNTRTLDLYEFFQSRDLKFLSEDYVKAFYNFLQQEVLKWMEKLIGCELTHISSTLSLYSNTDYLLVHDDRREDRMVAFVFYITGKSGWSKDKGGALQLFSKDELGLPSQTVKDIYPAHNQLIFFPVTNDSYHQVDEVISLEDCRLSINGWFHSKTVPNVDTIIPPPRSEGIFSNTKIAAKEIDIDLESWLEADYLNDEITTRIQEYFEENSEICLKKFLKDEPFHEISETLMNGDLKWRRIGPPNVINYEICDGEDLPHILVQFLGLFQSKQMYKLLQRFTDLSLTGMKYELQRWTPGCYSLLNDYDWKRKELDLMIDFGCKNNCDVIGARTQYVIIEDEVQDALITLDPEENNLNIIYRDTAKFTKYYSKQSRCTCFYSLVCTYLE